MAFIVLGGVLLLVLVFRISSPSFASEVSQTINNFAFNGHTGTNFFFSPYNIISAFGMIYAVAKEDTAREIDEALGVSSDIHASMGDLVRVLDNTGYISSANRVWLKNGILLNRTYIYTLRLNYGSSVQLFDFWVSYKTRGKIPHLLQTLNSEIRMVLTNAIYFNSEWQKKFNKSETKI